MRRLASQRENQPRRDKAKHLKFDADAIGFEV